jgi:hypothetical protein
MSTKRCTNLAVGMFAALAVLATAAWSAPPAKGTSDKTLFTAGKLRTVDVPASWKSAAVSGGFTNNLQGISGCEQQSAAADLRQRRAASRAFYDPVTRGTGGFPTQASNIVRVFSDNAAAGQFVAAFNADSARACLQQSNQNDLERRNPSADVTVGTAAPLTGLAPGGDDSAGHELAVTVTADQQTLTGYVDLTYVQVGRVVIGTKVASEQSQLLAQQPKIVTNPADRVGKVEK